MKPEYILLICAGGVFLIMLIIYMALAIKKSKIEKQSREVLLKAYSAKNLCKMEYDVAFYDKLVFKRSFNTDVESQVTIDDVLNENSANATELTQKAIFSQIENNGVEEIKGTFNPEK